MSKIWPKEYVSIQSANHLTMHAVNTYLVISALLSTILCPTDVDVNPENFDMHKNNLKVKSNIIQ